MASTVVVTIGYTDGSRKLSKHFTCADTHPSPSVLKSCENETLRLWTDQGHSVRDLKFNVVVKPAN